MRPSILALLFTLTLAGAAQETNTKEPFDPFANPHEELVRRANKAAKERKFEELKKAAAELVDVSRRMSEEIERGDKEVISAKVWDNLGRAERLLKTIREKAK